MWELLLPQDLPDREYILQGIRQGFRITDQDYQGAPVFVPNHRSAVSPGNFLAVEQQIKTEITHGRYLVVKHPPRITSALGAIPKSDGRVRLVHDCSRPVGQALNDLAQNDTFSYKSTEDAMAWIKPGSYLAKLDLASAYRSVGIHPLDYNVSGLSWRFQGQRKLTFMVDTCLMFGCSKAPYIFNTLTLAVCAIMAIQGFPGVVSYLDDFIVIGDDFTSCLGHLNTLLSLLRLLGFAINYSKVEGPVHSLQFLGVKLDTLSMTASLPQSKLEELIALIADTWRRPSTTKRTLQRLAGKMVWAARLIKLGRAHIRRIFDLISTLDHPSHRVKLSGEARQDMYWWLTCAPWANGTLPIRDHRDQTPLSIDACGYGGGGYYNGQGFHVVWQNWPEAETLCINYKEVIVLLPAVHIWGPSWANKVVNVHSDNKCAVAIINRGTAKHPMVMHVLRRIAWAAATWNFDLHAHYYPGEHNVVADALSRIPALPAIKTLKTLLGEQFLLSCVQWQPTQQH